MKICELETMDRMKRSRNKKSHSYIYVSESIVSHYPPDSILFRTKNAYGGWKLCPLPPKWMQRKRVLHALPPIHPSALETRSGLHPTHAVICSWISFKMWCQINRLTNQPTKKTTSRERSDGTSPHGDFLIPSSLTVPNICVSATVTHLMIIL